uniref:Uncharacterized protein n=1 Tax=Leersia perrieri TaxID=77586 RepID=A0A0D9W3X6_9ORYZ
MPRFCLIDYHNRLRKPMEISPSTRANATIACTSTPPKDRAISASSLKDVSPYLQGPKSYQGSTYSKKG